MRCRLCHLVGLVAGAAMASQGLVLAAPPPAGPNPEITLAADGLVLEWLTPPVEITTLAGGGVRVTMPGYPLQNEPGAPPLPVTSALVALPPGATAALEVLRDDEQILPLSGPVAAPPSPPAEAPPLSREPLQLKILGLVRGVNLARVVFSPARPDGNQLHVTTHVRAALRFSASGPASGLSAASGIFADPLLRTLQSLVVNPGQMQLAPRSAAGPAVSAQTGSLPQVAIQVSARGITAITYEALQTAGLLQNGPVDPHYFHLTRAGSDVSLQWDTLHNGANDSTFGPGQRLLFYAAPRVSRWAKYDVYMLTLDTATHPWMDSRSADPSGLSPGVALVDTLSESNLLYTPYCYCGPIPPGRDGDHWVWDALQTPATPDNGIHSAGVYASSALQPVAASQPATLTVWFIGNTDVPPTQTSYNHKVNLSLNGNALGSVTWSGQTAYTATLPIPARVVTTGSNSLSLSLPGVPGVSIDGLWLDAFSIGYARSPASAGLAADFTGAAAPYSYTLGLASTSGLRAYDVTDEDHPVALTGVVTGTTTVTLGDVPGDSTPRHYALSAESGLLTPGLVRPVVPLVSASVTGADYVIITYPDFAAALPPLFNLRQSQGFIVVTETTQAIYDAFDGLPTPDAIHAYLFNAYQNWRPRPGYVLLVGGGNFDPEKHWANSPTTYVPPYLAEVDAWGGETAADNRYVVFTDTTNLPSMLIGRLPVSTPAEAQTVVNKIVNYDTHPLPGDWNSYAVFVAGHNLNAGDDFGYDSVTAMTQVPPGFVTVGPPPAPSAADATHLRWNQGAGLMMYSGHSSFVQWDLPPLFHLDDVASLTNGPRLPVVLEMTCFTSAFHLADTVTLDEALLRDAGGGAVAVWGSTGLGLASGHQALAAGFLSTVYSDTATLGDATYTGKLNLAGSADLVDTYTLLGDPAMRLDLTIVPWPYTMYLPAVGR